MDALCQRWGCPPSVVLQEDAHYVLRMMALLAEGPGRAGADDAEPPAGRAELGTARGLESTLSMETLDG